MSDLFEEVEEQLRSDRYRQFGRKVLPWLLGAAGAALIVTLGYWGYDSFRSSQISKASDQYAAAMEAFLKKNQVSFPIVRDAAQKLVAAANVSTMPTSFLIDKQGVIQHVHTGFREKDAADLLAQINALLA